MPSSVIMTPSTLPMTKDGLIRIAGEPAPGAARVCTRVVIVILLLCGFIQAQAAPQKKTFVVNGATGEATVVQIDGRIYVDLAALAQIGNGSVGYQENRITVALPQLSVSAPPASPQSEEPSHTGLSQGFMKAGIETLAQLREWASTLGYAIQHGYGVTDAWVADYRAQAAQSLRLATVTASTDSDRNALQLLTHEFDAVGDWSNKLVEAKKSMDVGKYAVSPDALRNDPSSQKIITCGHFLASMLASGSFQDDASCR